jgi:heptosyltransferase-3
VSKPDFPVVRGQCGVNSIFKLWRGRKPVELRAADRYRLIMPGRGNRSLRRLDRYAGIPLVFGLGTLRGRRTLPSRPRRIGLLNTAAIGDTILMSAPLADLRASFQDAEIALLVGPSNYEAACLLKQADKVVRLPVFNLLAAAAEIRKQRLDLLVDFGPWARLNAVLAIVSGAGFIVGFRTRGQYRHYGYDISIDHSPLLHELENYRNLMAALGVSARHSPRIDPKRILVRELTALRSPYVVFHLWPGGTRGDLKQWPITRWIMLSNHWIDQGFDVILTGGPSQRALNDAVIAKTAPANRHRIHNVAGVSLAATASIASDAHLVVSVDTGLMHLGAALNVPLVALMGPTSSKRWGPIGQAAVAIDSPAEGAGYLYLGFEPSHGAPRHMEAISFDTVRRVCDETLSLYRRQSEAALR